MKLSIAAAIMAFTSTSALAAPSPGPDPLEVVLSVDEVDLRIMGMNPTGNDHPTSGHPLNIVGITMIGESPRFMHNTVVNRDNKPNPLWPEGNAWKVNFIAIAGLANCIFFDEKGVKQAQVVSTKSGASTSLCGLTALKTVKCDVVATS